MGIMKKQRSDHRSGKDFPMRGKSSSSPKNVLGAFFALLLRIDKRNNPSFYEGHKDTNYPHSS